MRWADNRVTVVTDDPDLHYRMIHFVHGALQVLNLSVERLVIYAEAIDFDVPLSIGTSNCAGYLDLSRRPYEICLNRQRIALPLTCCHELIHVEQVHAGRLQLAEEGWYWEGQFISSGLPHGQRPWEQEARQRQRQLYDQVQALYDRRSSARLRKLGFPKGGLSPEHSDVFAKEAMLMPINYLQVLEEYGYERSEQVQASVARYTQRIKEVLLVEDSPFDPERSYIEARLNDASQLLHCRLVTAPETDKQQANRYLLRKWHLELSPEGLVREQIDSRAYEFGTITSILSVAENSACTFEFLIGEASNDD